MNDTGYLHSASLETPTIFLSFRFYNLMASSGPNPNVSFFQFQDVFNTALIEYA